MFIFDYTVSTAVTVTIFLYHDRGKGSVGIILIATVIPINDKLNGAVAVQPLGV
jgi:hypothetical protein